MGNGQFGFIDARNMDLDSMDITKMMNDMQSMQPKAEVKKKKKDKKEEPEFTLKDIPALGTLLKLKPVLQIQGEKLDSFAKARTVKQAKKMMIDAMRNDFDHRFNDPEGKNIYLEMAYTHNLEDAEAFKKEVEAEFPGMEIVLNPLSLSVSCHIGPGALAVACSKKIPELLE